MEYYQEENNYPKAFLATGIIMAVLIALCYFIVFKNPPKQEDGTGGILVNYGTTDEGMGTDYMSTEEPSKSPKPTHTKATKIPPPTPTPQKTQVDQSDKKVVTQTTEDAPVVNDNSKKVSKTVATEPVKKIVKQTIDNRAMFKGMSSKGNGSGDGTTNTPGNQGSTNGSNISDNYGPGGSGAGLHGMPQWSFVDPLNVKNESRTPGRVAIDITVDPSGHVISATINRQKTRMADIGLINRCIDIVKNSKLTTTTPTSDNQKGQVVFIFNVD
jgi:hypothetical protein